MFYDKILAKGGKYEKILSNNNSRHTQENQHVI
jgi:hypothetical protein